MKKGLFTRVHISVLFFVVLLWLVAFFAAFSSGETAQAADDVIEISTVEQMIAFSADAQTSSHVGKRVELRADLDLTGTAFLPIGNASCRFEGSFNGNDHTLFVDLDNMSGATGVFGYTGSACRISGLTVKGNVEGTNYVGGIVGDADGGRVERCISFATVTGNSYVGGIVGYCKGVVTECVSFAEVRARNIFGGVAGSLQGNRSALTESLFIGKIVSNSGTVFGGLIGDSAGLLKNNYAVPSFEGSLSVSYGSVVGKLSSATRGVSYCYAVSNKGPVGSNVSGATPDTLAAKTSYDFLSGSVSFDTDTLLVTCAFDIGFGYYPCPAFLLNSEGTSFVEPFDSVCSGKLSVCLFESGVGSEGEPFVVTTARQWDLFARNSRLYDYSGRYVSLGASVQAGSVLSVGDVDHPFSGVFDGNGHTVSFSCASTGNSKVGLFSVISGATIKNVVLSGQVTGGTYVGLAAGYATGASDSFMDVTITDASLVSGTSYVGAVVGGSAGGTEITVSDCVSSASVFGENNVGGLIGSCPGEAYVTDCTNLGVITNTYNGGRNVGGIVGCFSGVPHLSRLINKGAVHAAGCTSVGGIVGSVAGGSVALSSCVSSVIGRFGVGGIFGEITSDVSVTSCSYIGTITGVNALGSAVGDLSSGTTLSVTDYYCVASFVKDKTVSLTVPFRCFCIASPQIETTTDISGAYEYYPSDYSFRLTSDVTTQAGKTYYRFSSGLTLQNVYYNSDVYLGLNTNGAIGCGTVGLSDGDRTRFDEPDEWKEVSVTLQGGYYPIPACAEQADYSVAYFAGGTGTEEDPLLISNEKQFRNFAEFFNSYPASVSGKYFLQTADIDLTRAFTVITYFIGHYDGNNHIISGLNIESSEERVGLFGEASGELKNMCVDGGKIVATAANGLVGGLVAAGNLEIRRCYAALDIHCENAAWCGGLVGVNDGNVTASFFAGTIRGGACTGGLIGKNNSGDITSVFTTGTIYGKQTLGGIIGYNNGGTLSFSSTNVVAELTQNESTCALGGLVGVNVAVSGGTSGRILSCLSNAWLNYGANVKRGGLVGDFVSGEISSGDIDGDGNNDNSYYNLDYATGIANNGMGTLTDVILRTTTINGQAVRSFRIPNFTYEGLGDYNNECDARYALRPTAIAEWAESVYRVNYYSACGAEMVMWRYDYSVLDDAPRGSSGNPYLISKPEELAFLSQSTKYYDYTGKYFVLTSDLNMSDVDLFLPIGFYRDSDHNYYFNGQLDGCGRKIRNLTIDFYAFQTGAGRQESDNRYVALFGYTGPDFVLKRLVMDSSCRICGGPYTSSFVGYFNGRIEECYSSCEIVSVRKATVTSSTYEEGAFWTWEGEGAYVPCVGAYSSTTSYYSPATNVGGFVGDLVTGGCAIIKSVFDGTLPNVENAFGFVGVSGMALSLSTDDSWYITTDKDYAYESSYGRVLVDYSDANNGGTVAVGHDWGDTHGFYVTLTANEKFYPFIYNNNLDALSRTEKYYLTSTTQVKYQIRYCQEVVFEIENGVVGTETVLAAQGNVVKVGGKYYYYNGQEGSVTYTWAKRGYYLLDTVSVDGVSSSLGSSIHNGTEEEIVLSFVMGETTDVFVIRVTVNEITSAQFVFSGPYEFDYDGTVHSVGYSVGDGFAATLIYVNETTGSRASLTDAGSYYALASLRFDGSSVVIGRIQVACSVLPKTLSVAPAADLSYLGRKVYDGNITKRALFTDLSVLVGILEGEESSLSVSALVTWDSADSGTGKSYSLSDFQVISNTNYVFANDYELTGFSDGVIEKRRVVVSVPGAVTTTFGDSEYEVSTVVYSGKSPVAPAGTYVTTVSWSYQKQILSDSAAPINDTTWSGKYDVGYYLMTPSLADETNHELDTEGKIYYLRIVPYTVTSLTYVYNDLKYTGAALTSSVTAYFEGVGEDGSRQNVSIQYYVRKEGVTAQTFTDGLFVQNTAGTGFDAATEFDATASYYVVAQLRKAGVYYASCTSLRDNYVVAASIYKITVAKAVAEQELTFKLYCGGEEVPSGGSVYYTDDIVIVFTDTLSLRTADAEYDAVYMLSFDSRPNGGDLTCVSVGDEWHISPQEYGSEMVFRLVSLSANDYENRTSTSSFTLTVLPVKLYVGITHPEQVFGEEVDFSLTYYKDPEHTETIAADDIAGLFAPVVSTGAFAADRVGTYQLFYGGGSSYGYEFDRTTVPELTILPRTVYVSVPAEIANTKTYGEADPDIRYYVYADENCTERISVLPNGQQVVLNGNLSRAEGEDVGAYDIYAGSIVSSTLNPDYSLQFVRGNGKFVIMYLDIRLQVKEGQGKYYGDEDQPYELELCEGYFLANGDLISLFTSGQNPVVTISRESGEEVGSYAFIVDVDYTLATEGNYNILNVDAPGYYYINRVRPRIEFEFTGTVYYGDTTDQMGHGAARAYNNSDVVPGTFSWTQKSFNSMDVTRVTLNFTPRDTRNYVSNSITIVVTPQKRPVYPIFTGSTQYVYDGSAHNDITVGLDGTVGQSGYTVRTRVSGDNRTVTEEGFTVTAELTSDLYVFPEDAAVSIACKIVPAVVTVRVKNAVVTYGETFLPEIVYEGFISSESESVLTARAALIEVPEESGVYTITPAGAAAKNYVFKYLSGVLTINKTLAESEGVSVSGSFYPGVEVELNEIEDGTYAFEDLESIYDKKLGATFFTPLSYRLSSYYGIVFTGVLEEDAEYTYTISLTDALPSGAKLYVRDMNGELVELEDFDEEEGEVTFRAGNIDALLIYREKTQEELLKGYIPLAIAGGAVIVIIMIVGIFLYFGRHMRGKDVYRAERATYKSISHRK